MCVFQSYRDFHNDLYPDTDSYHTDLSAAEWIKGIDKPLAKMSLDPANRELPTSPIMVSERKSSLLPLSCSLSLSLSSIIVSFTSFRESCGESVLFRRQTYAFYLFFTY